MSAIEVSLVRTGIGPRPASFRRRAGPIVLALGLYAALAFFAYWRAWFDGPAGHTFFPGGDQAVSMWFLSWVAYAVVHGHNPLFSTVANYPYGVNTIANAQPLPVDFLLIPVTLLAGPVVSYNLLGTLAPFASATAAFFLMRRFVRWQPAAFAGGLLYGFSPFVVQQGVGHSFLAFAAFPPLIFLVLHDLLVRQRGRPVLLGVVLGILVTLQFLTSAEELLSTVVVAVAAVVVLAVRARHSLLPRLRFPAVGVGSAVLVAGVLLAYPLWMQFEGPQHVVGALQRAPQIYRADLLGAVLPTAFQLISPAGVVEISSRFAGNGVENSSYLGVPLIALVVVAAVYLRRRTEVVVAAILAGFAFIMSLGSSLTIDHHATIPMPEGIFDAIPVLDNAIPVRYSLYVFLFTGLILAFALAELHRYGRRTSYRLGVTTPLVVAVAALFPLVPAWPYQMTPASIPPYFTSAAAQAIPAGSVVMVYPFPDADFASPQLWQASTFFRFQMPGGRFNVPKPVTGTIAYSEPSKVDSLLSELASGQPLPMDEATRDAILGQLRSWHIHTVIVVPGGPNAAQAVSYLVWLFGPAPKDVGGVFVWYDWR